MKTHIVALSFAAITLFSYKERTKTGAQTQPAVTAHPVVTVESKKNAAPAPKWTKWFYKDLNTVFIKHLKSNSKDHC
jgi:hypothetical protein